MATKWEFKKITLEMMMDYIETNAPEDKEWFKSVAIDKNGNYQHLIAVRAFCNRYMKDIIPEKKEKAPNKSEKLKNW